MSDERSNDAVIWSMMHDLRRELEERRPQERGEESRQ